MRQRERKQLQRYIELLHNKKLVDEYTQYIDRILGAHKKSDSAVDWARLYAVPAPYGSGGAGPKEQEARQALEAFAPRWYERGALMRLAERRRAALAAAVEQAAAEDRAAYEQWRAQHELAAKVLAGDADAYLRVIAEKEPLDDLQQLGSGFEFEVKDGTALEVVFRAHSERVVPTEELSLTKTGRLSRKELSKSSRNKLIQDVVCSCALRIARDLTSLLPVQKVVVHAVDELVDTAAGRLEEYTILSVAFERGPLLALQFERIDPSDAVRSFPHRMSFAAVTGFQPVERLHIS